MSSLILPNDKLENVKMVIFDKDGTLIDVHHYWCSMIEYRAEFFVNTLNIPNREELYEELINNMGIDINIKKMKPEGPVGIKPRSFIVGVALKTIQKYDETYTKDMVENIFTKVDEYSKTKLDVIVKALPDVERLLKDLKNADMKLTIATTDLSQRALLAMEALKLDKYFVDIVGVDLVTNAKPSPDLIEYILIKNSLLKKDVVVIGDSMADFGMAQNAECKFIGVKSGLYTDEFISKSKYVIDSLEQLKVQK